jgi:hypothetical protein
MADNKRKSEMDELITRISNSVDKKNVQSCCKKILKKCSFKSDNDLSNVKQLAFWLYIYGYYDEAISVCDLLKDMEFTGNYRIWDNADNAMCLKARILREQGKLPEREELLKKVNEHRHPELYKNLVDWYRGTLNENINSDSSTLGKLSWMMTKLTFAVRYREAGGHPISDDEFERDISELLKILRSVK